MNTLQKFLYMALGAVIMALGIIIGQFVTQDIEAQANGVFDKIQCRELVVVNKHGGYAIELVSNEEGNQVSVFNKHGKLGIDLVTTEDDNAITIFDHYKNPRVFLVSGKKVDGLAVLDKAGNVEASIP